MSSITITLTSICPGGNHLTFAITGDRTATLNSVLAELSEPLDDDDVETFVRVVCRMVKAGRTVNQARNVLQAGVTITV